MVDSNPIQAQYDGHILVLSFPLQGHVAPLIKLSNRMCKLGVKVTFVATEFILAKMAPSMAGSDQEGNGIRFLPLPDGLESDDDRKDSVKMTTSICQWMPDQLENLLNTGNDATDRYTGVLIDSPLTFLLEIPKKMGIPCSTYWCSTPGCIALGVNIEKLAEDKVIDIIDGSPLKNEKVQFLPDMPAMSPAEFTWSFPADLNKQKTLFHYIKFVVDNMVLNSDWILCNWFDDLDTSASTLLPNILPVGPLLADGQSAGSFVSEDSSCLTWLDEQSPGSVIYVAFGSTSRFSQEQINELALGLELMEKPFLWVAWSGLTNGGTTLTFPDGFTDRVANRGKIVDWAPQERVLAHPSITCFISHCGWGSFMESLSMGVPFLCWPYFGDQLYTESCICEAWKVGVWLNADENGMISRGEIKQKVENLICDINIRSNAAQLKEMARKSILEGGSSYKSLEYFVIKCSVGLGH